LSLSLAASAQKEDEVKVDNSPNEKKTETENVAQPGWDGQ